MVQKVWYSNGRPSLVTLPFFREDAPELLEGLVGVVLELGCFFLKTLTSSLFFILGVMSLNQMTGCLD